MHNQALMLVALDDSESGVIHIIKTEGKIWDLMGR